MINMDYVDTVKYAHNLYQSIRNGTTSLRFKTSTDLIVEGLISYNYLYLTVPLKYIEKVILWCQKLNKCFWTQKEAKERKIPNLRNFCTVPEYKEVLKFLNSERIPSNNELAETGFIKIYNNIMRLKLLDLIVT